MNTIVNNTFGPDFEICNSYGFIFHEPAWEWTVKNSRRKTLEPVVWRDKFITKYSADFKQLFLENADINGTIQNNLIVVKSGFESDGATFPSKLDWLARRFGIEHFGKYYLPSIIHDKCYRILWTALYDRKIGLQQFFTLRNEIDWLFLDCMRDTGITGAQANFIYIIVRNCGHTEWEKRQ
jgi:hypothetical protein